MPPNRSSSVALCPFHPHRTEATCTGLSIPQSSQATHLAPRPPHHHLRPPRRASSLLCLHLPAPHAGCRAPGTSELSHLQCCSMTTSDKAPIPATPHTLPDQGDPGPLPEDTACSAQQDPDSQQTPVRSSTPCIPPLTDGADGVTTKERFS